MSKGNIIKNENGFTIVELLVVILVLIIIVVSIISYS